MFKNTRSCCDYNLTNYMLNRSLRHPEVIMYNTGFHLTSIPRYTVLYVILIIIDTVMGVNNYADAFAILTEGCAIRGFPEVSDSIRDIVAPPTDMYNCSNTITLVKSNSTHLWVDKDTFADFSIWNEDNFYCCYRSFSAISVENVVYEKCKEFSTSITVEHEFVRVECYVSEDKMYDDFFLFDFNDTVISRSKHDEKDYNILILGLESLSRMNFHRTMPLTSTFLLKKGMIELFGYNKLGDNSYPNLFPLLTGKSFDFVKKFCLNDTAIFFDTNKCQFIWDRFKDKEYFTAMGSDSIAALLGYYEYHLEVIPTHFYMQPFILETRNVFHNKMYHYHQCMGSKYYYKILIDYIYSLTRKLSSNKLFGMFWEESISHEDLNRPRVMDETYYNFLTTLKNDGYLNKTILIVLSDHGMRWGSITRTDQGHLEERLPLFGILFPKEFRNRYKVAFRNIQANSNRLVTPFDVHETLLHLLNQRSLSDEFINAETNVSTSTQSSSSLFFPISPRRTCEYIGIAEHWCACYKGRKIIPGPKMKPLISGILIDHLNNLLKEYPQCQKLTLKKILHVSLIENNKAWRMYTVIVLTNPGGAIFDGTLLRHKPTWKVSGTVSRLNLYRHQSYCVNEELIKLYCYCS